MGIRVTKGTTQEHKYARLDSAAMTIGKGAPASLALQDCVATLVYGDSSARFVTPHGHHPAQCGPPKAKRRVLSINSSADQQSPTTATLHGNTIT